MDHEHATSAVRALLAAAGLQLTDADIAAFAAAYPGVRAGADLLHATTDANEADGALVFRPTDAAYEHGVEAGVEA